MKTEGMIAVMLGCHHEIYFRAPYPRVSDLLWCRYCRTDQRVVATGAHFEISCDGCRLGHGYGDNLTSARAAASRHVLRYKTHAVTIWKSGLELEVVRNDGAHEELPFASVLKSRRELAKENQRILRELLDGK